MKARAQTQPQSTSICVCKHNHKQKCNTSTSTINKHLLGVELRELQISANASECRKTSTTNICGVVVCISLYLTENSKKKDFTNIRNKKCSTCCIIQFGQKKFSKFFTKTHRFFYVPHLVKNVIQLP